MARENAEVGLLGLADQGADQRRLADPCLAANKDEPAATSRRDGEFLAQDGLLPGPAGQDRQGARQRWDGEADRATRWCRAVHFHPHC